MAETTVVEQADWNGVYYDAYHGDFLLVQVIEDGITLLNPVSGNPFHTMTAGEFIDESDEFVEVTGQVLLNPTAVLKDAVQAGLSAHDGDYTEANDLDPIAVEFARECVDWESHDEMAWESHIDWENYGESEKESHTDQD